MKNGGHKDDYTSGYEVVPDWVEEFREDWLSDGYVISRQSGEWVMTNEKTVICLEDNR